MDEKIAISIEEIKRELNRLKELDFKKEVFGASKHQYTSHPVSNAEVERFEGELGLRLPEEYRQFLLQIGYGAGPYYGLAAPDDILKSLREGQLTDQDRFPVPSQPFPLGRALLEERWQRTAIPTSGVYLSVTEATKSGSTSLLLGT